MATQVEIDHDKPTTVARITKARKNRKTRDIAVLKIPCASYHKGEGESKLLSKTKAGDALMDNRLLFVSYFTPENERS